MPRKALTLQLHGVSSSNMDQNTLVLYEIWCFYHNVNYCPKFGEKMTTYNK